MVMAKSYRLADNGKMPDYQAASIGERIKHWRTKQGISQLDLALICDTSARHISFIETGKATPTRELLITLADAIGIPLSVRNNLLIAAGFAAEHKITGLNDDELQQAQHVMQNMVLQNQHNPSLLMDRYWDINFNNQAFECLCQYFLNDSPLLQKPVNLLELFLDPKGFIQYCLEPDQLYLFLSSRFRRAMSVIENTDELSTLYSRLQDYKPSTLLHNELSLPQLITPIQLKKGNIHLELSWLTATLGEPLSICLREFQLELFMPTNDHSRQWLEAHTDG